MSAQYRRRTTIMAASIDFKAMNRTVQPMFWAAFGAILVTAVVVPVLGTVGKVISEKVEKKFT